MSMVALDRSARVHACLLAVSGFVDIATDAPAIRDVYDALCAHVNVLLSANVAAQGPARDDADVAYAIVAFADEMAIRAGEDLAAYWMPRILQVRFFEEHAAGEQFYERLDALMARRAPADVMRVYYGALALGFVGRFAHEPAHASRAAYLLDLARRIAEREPVAATALHIDARPLQAAPARPDTDAPGMGLCSWWTARRAWCVLGSVSALSCLFFGLATLYLRGVAQPSLALAQRLVEP